MSNETAKQMGAAIRHWRESRKLSQHQLAKEAGLHLNTISSYERAKSSPRAGNLLAVAKALGVELRQLMGDGKTETETSTAPDGGQLWPGFGWLPYLPEWDGTPVRGEHKQWQVRLELVSGDACLVMRVKDDAMRPCLMAGDVILVDAEKFQLRPLDLVVVRVGEEVLIRRYMAREGTKIFSTLLSGCPAIVVGPDTDYKVLARVVAFVGRDLKPSETFEFGSPY